MTGCVSTVTQRNILPVISNLAAKEIIGLKAKGVGGIPNEMLINMHILLFFKASPVWLCSNGRVTLAQSDKRVCHKAE